MNYLKGILLFVFLFVGSFNLRAQAQELRGAWVAWAGNNVPSKKKIAQMMDDLADANFNIVYVDVWRFGYPYFQSEVFYNHTGLWTDPGIEEGRDVLADMIAEAHRVGLEVEAWFEAGFAASQAGNTDLFDRYPHWFARKKNGNTSFFANGGIEYKWLSHCNEDAQNFLFELCKEVAAKYDVDGIEFDRVRYPDLDCGYDSATVELYKSEHNGNPPPTNTANSAWVRWRADKLNLFMADMYEKIKAVNPELTISNAPLWYGYEQFCQDWPAWINEGSLDVVVPQIYYAYNSQYTYRLDIELGKVNDKSTFYPGISTVANGVYTTNAELVKMIESTRARNLEGHVIWFYDNLVTHFETLKSSVYENPAEIPYREPGWRQPAIIVHETDELVRRSDNWSVFKVEVGTLPYEPGLDDSSLVTSGGKNDWIEYQAEIPEDSWYELYVFIVPQWNANPEAQYIVYSDQFTDTVYVEQQKLGHARWYKIGDFKFNKGLQKIIRLTDENIGQHNLFADAIMLLNTNRVREPSSLPDKKDGLSKPPTEFRINKAWPNPFNSNTRIEFFLPEAGRLSAEVYDISGQQVQTLVNHYYTAGTHNILWNAKSASSGIYFVKLSHENMHQYIKVILVK